MNEHTTKTFCASEKHFAVIVFKKGANYSRIDIIFDRYRSVSIKGQTRQKRSKICHPVRRVIEYGTVRLPPNWSNFQALPENKAGLAQFLLLWLVVLWKNVMHALMNHILMSDIYQQTMKKQTPESFYMQFTANKPLV